MTLAKDGEPLLYLTKGMTEKLVFGWCGGKDAALALYELKHEEGIEIAALLTTVTEGYRLASSSVNA